MTEEPRLSYEDVARLAEIEGLAVTDLEAAFHEARDWLGALAPSPERDLLTSILANSIGLTS